MISAARQAFNEQFTPAGYTRLRRLLEERCGGPVAFRVSETPCFIPLPLLERLASDGRDLIAQLVAKPAYREQSETTVPEKYRVPGEPERPLFIQVDFGLCRGQTGEVEPRLVEIQAFPSLYAFQPVLAQAYLDAYELGREWRYLARGLELAEYEKLLREAVVGRHDPAHVVLLEIDPAHQKTACDFRLTEKLTGIRTVCITKLRRRGSQLYYDDNGRETPIRRIYNRCIVDELERRGITPQFDYRAQLDVEWAGHPNFYFRISKFSIPHLRHPSVPKTWFLDELDRIPEDPENYVLKPLYSFAGTGVVVGPSRAEIEAVPKAQRHHYILQERVEFAPLVETPHGGTKVEVRVMYVWPEEESEPRAVCWILRMGRGKMMGVDHNKDMEWVGASAALAAAPHAAKPLTAFM